jgi:hypothetical protein
MLRVTDVESILVVMGQRAKELIPNIPGAFYLRFFLVGVAAEAGRGDAETLPA